MAAIGRFQKGDDIFHAKIVDGEIYLSPQEASTVLGISYKTLQRWVEAGEASTWVGTNGNRRRKSRRVNIEVRYTPTGYRLYNQKSIQRLHESLAAATFSNS